MVEYEYSGEGLSGAKSSSSSGIIVGCVSGCAIRVEEEGDLVLEGGSSVWRVCSLG